MDVNVCVFACVFACVIGAVEPGAFDCVLCACSDLYVFE